jgi:hypothetical protein
MLKNIEGKMTDKERKLWEIIIALSVGFVFIFYLALNQLKDNRFNWKKIPQTLDGETLRESSWDKKGTNFDYVNIGALDVVTIADIKGQGYIRHIWMTTYSKDIGHYRKTLIGMRWDDQEKLSVDIPFGDFFCQGHSIVNSFQSLLFAVSSQTNNVMDGKAAFNCYIPMPFRKRAEIKICNTSNKPFMLYYHIDYEKCKVNRNDGYFHAFFNRSFFERSGKENGDKINLDGENNHIILDTQGKGTYIGCNLTVINDVKMSNGKLKWWGEGDEMIFIDGDKTPTINGTGAEDYFGQAWGMTDTAFLFSGLSMTCREKNTEYQTCYVFHIPNPIRFKKSIKVTIERGHANQLKNDFSSVAYWYQMR